MDSVRIGRRRIGDGYPCFNVAEVGVNHNGDLALAHGLIEVAAYCGADTVKFQTFAASAPVANSAEASAIPERAGSGNAARDAGEAGASGRCLGRPRPACGRSGACVHIDGIRLGELGRQDAAKVYVLNGAVYVT